MKNTKTPYRNFFSLSSLITAHFPRAGARVLDASLTFLLGNRLLLGAQQTAQRLKLGRVREFRRILVIGDLNIGDAVLLQSAVSALRDYFPEATIDYAINRYARMLVEGNHEISRLWPLFTGTYFADQHDFDRLKDIVAANAYDVIFNFCPLFNESRLPGDAERVGYTPLGMQLIHDQRDPKAVNHIAVQTHRYIDNLLLPLRVPQRRRPFGGVTVTLGDGAIHRADEFLRRREIGGSAPLFFNPDASSVFTRIPFEYQARLLRRLADTGRTVLLGAGHTVPDIGRRLLETLPSSLARQVIIVPSSLPLDAYAALIDRCSIFISGDTGPLHIAAARKISRTGSSVFRNRTAIVSIFGATPSRVYGYDSRQAGHSPANQDAPSWSYASGSSCRNITCINKMAKTCENARCFATIDVDHIVSDLQHYLHGISGTHYPPPPP